MKSYKKQKGITLVALVVTIVILLILAGVSLNLVLGENGLIRKADEGRINYTNASEEERGLLNDLSDALDAYASGSSGSGSGGGEEGPLAEYKQNSMLQSTTNTTIQVSYGQGTTPVTIPAKYKVASDSGNTADEGIVIVDSVGNEWVWVPVPNNGSLEGILYTAAEIIEGTSEPETNDEPETIDEPETLDEPVSINTGLLSGETGVITSKYSKSEIITGEFINAPDSIDTPILYSLSRSHPGDITNWREPDLVTSYDTDERAVTAGFTNLTNMAETLVSEYSQMIASIEQYKGFWIGRYELSGTVSSPKVKKGTTGVNEDLPIRYENWYSLHKACKSLSADTTKASSRMIWGCLWDATCNYIAEGGTYSITDSTSWGNYSNTVAVTGSNENWKAKNIYDLAGNVSESTQEAIKDYGRVIRGINYGGINQYLYTVAGRSRTNPTSMINSTRPTLILLPTE